MWIVHPEQVDLVTASIVQSYRTAHSFKSVRAVLQLLFNAHRDIENVLREQILHTLLSDCSAEEVLTTVVQMIKQLSGERWNQ